MCVCTWAVGLPRSSINASSFPTDRDGLPPAPSPYILRSRVHPLVSSALLQSSFWQSSARASTTLRQRPELLPWVPSLFTTSTRGVHCVSGIPCPSPFRPQRFTRSRRFAPPRALRIYFAALPCPGFSLQGFPPPIQPRHISVAATLAPLAPPPAGFPAPANVASTSGSCSRPESAVSGGFFRPARHPCPLLRFQLPRACLQRP